MKKQPFIILFLSFFLLLGSAAQLTAQFSNGAVINHEEDLTGRAWHISSKKDNNYLLQRGASGFAVGATGNTINTESTFVIESGPDDGDWTTADKRWFLIRCLNTSLYVTVSSDPTEGSLVTLQNLNTGNALKRQQFRTVASPIGSGWNKIRSHVSTDGPDRVLAISTLGQLILEAPAPDPSPEQKFAFNLAMPNDASVPYVLIGALSHRFLTNEGIKSSGKEVKQQKTSDHSALWQLIRLGNGNYRIKNTITAAFLEVSTDVNDLRVKTSVQIGPTSEWQLIRKDATFNIKNVYNSRYLTGLNVLNNFQVYHGVYDEPTDSKWIVARIDQPEAVPIAQPFSRIAQGSAPGGCAVIFGPGFKKALAERVGLPADEAYFPILEAAVEANYGPGTSNDILSRFDLNNPGHRIDLTLMLRKYMLENLAWKIEPLTPLEAQTLAYFEQKASAIRVDFANRLTAAWSAYNGANFNSANGFSTLLDNLDADGFQWPAWHDVSTSQAEFLGQYVSGAAYFQEKNPQAFQTLSPTIVSSASIGVGVTLQALVFGKISGEAALGLLSEATVTSLGQVASTTLTNFVQAAGAPIAVITMATQILIMETLEVVEVQELLDEINNVYNWANEPVNIQNIMRGDNILHQIRLFEDLDYMMGAPTLGTFVNNTNDNQTFPAFDISCQNSINVELDATGHAQITPDMLGSAGMPLCGDAVMTFTSAMFFDCQDLGVNPILFIAKNDKQIRRCTVSVQIIDRIAPLISCPPDQTVDMGSTCQSAIGSWQLVSKTDNCTDQNAITQSQSPPANSLLQGHNATQIVTLSATDSHENTRTCQFAVTLKDTRPPTISCPANTTLTATNSANCTVPVNQINANFADNCTAATLSYALTGATTGAGSGQTSGFVFNSGSSSVTYTVTDGAGLQANCSFLVKVNPCLNGKIIWQQDPLQGVKDVNVAITGDHQTSATTDLNGVYSIAFPGGSNFTISPTKNLNKLNGINAQDVSRLQQHLMGNLITSPWQLIAADVNSNGTINSLDLSILQQAILGNPSAQAQMIKSWRFVPTTYVLTNPPWGFPESTVLTGANGNQVNKDFYGIKVGDLVANYASPANAAPAPAFVLAASDKILQAGDALTVDFQAGQTDDLAAFQFGLHFDLERLELTSVETLAALPLSEDDFRMDAGNLNILWAGTAGINLPEAAPVFRLRFKVLAGGGQLSEALRLNEETLPAWAYRSDAAASKVVLHYFGVSSANNLAIAEPHLKLFQNQPNPFVGTTQIGFELPESCTAQLRIFDAAGRVVALYNRPYSAGMQREVFEPVGASGVLYYELTTPFGVLTKKMVVTQE